MTLTVHILRPLATQGSELSLTFDAPRIVIGRSTSCELVLPDPTVSARHASIRHRGTDFVIADEGSTNGIMVGTVKLPAHTPRVVRSGELVRIGRVWLELQLGVGMAGPARQGEAVARQWLVEQLRSEGEQLDPTLRVVAGPDAGASFVLREPDREVIVGRSREVDWSLCDDKLSRRHVGVTYRGAEVVVRDLGSKRGSELGGRRLSQTAVAWRASEQLHIGEDQLELSDPLPEAMAEQLRAPDERMRASEFAEPPPGRAGAEGGEPVVEAPSEDVAASDDAEGDGGGGELDDEANDAERASGQGQQPRAADRGFPLIELLVVLLALGMLGVSVAGLLWLLRG